MIQELLNLGRKSLNTHFMTLTLELGRKVKLSDFFLFFFTTTTTTTTNNNNNNDNNNNNK